MQATRLTLTAQERNALRAKAVLVRRLLTLPPLALRTKHLLCHLFALAFGLILQVALHGRLAPEAALMETVEAHRGWHGQEAFMEQFYCLGKTSRPPDSERIRSCTSTRGRQRCPNKLAIPSLV